jgi:hypothetical protein
MILPEGIRWHCPHCDGCAFTIPAGEEHLRINHHDCVSCSIERLVLVAIMEGKGQIVIRQGPEALPF